jgi:hypothetical protein
MEQSMNTKELQAFCNSSKVYTILDIIYKDQNIQYSVDELEFRNQAFDF